VSNLYALEPSDSRRRVVSDAVDGNLLDDVRKRYPNAPVETRRSPIGSPVLSVVRVPNDEVPRIEAQFRARASR
jgi:hypothetical protein